MGHIRRQLASERADVADGCSNQSSEHRTPSGGSSKAQPFDCRINRVCGHVTAGTFKIAAGRFREAAESTVDNHTAGDISA
jgi:hypothetical protein